MVNSPLLFCRIALCVLPFVWGCHAAATVAPFQGASQINGVSEEESRLWTEGRDFDEVIEHGGQRYPDQALQDYVQSILDGLYPEFKGTFHVRILKSPYLNAFALPHGSVYINLGMIARFDNEAQLATVLAHEGAHFVHRHAFKNRGKLKSGSAFAQITLLMGLPGAIVGNILALSSIYGYSQDLEREADQVGFERLKLAGYDTAQGGKVFDHLAVEVKDTGVEEPFFFSTHPRLMERVESYQEMNRLGGSDGRQETETFLKKTNGARIDSLKEDLARGRYKAIIHVLGAPEKRNHYPAYSDYYLGEAYRLRNDEGDGERALASYREAIKHAPEFAPSYRSLGIYYKKKNDFPKAIEYLGTYKKLAPGAEDIPYIEQYIEEMEKQ